MASELISVFNGHGHHFSIKDEQDRRLSLRRRALGRLSIRSHTSRLAARRWGPRGQAIFFSVSRSGGPSMAGQSVRVGARQLVVEQFPLPVGYLAAGIDEFVVRQTEDGRLGIGPSVPVRVLG